ncbi:aldehyde dehydrogenase family protein [Rhodobacteraceae bacterium HSP-20]|uniref:Aldehyde dehydrogenase family protein n=1 Tax=Paragemmobacter amnigenus TaxID=2852097 RepID=A0ABS6J8I2_9RHOB|nr:aldehyde dehydrogenase family protein [Rhodobacter amnigenus]MBU9700043.1 aldehyde dehydrogenase family protein [Rhodobacter amnigenus]MBV4391270.1 aldehyde dehydrogenase family protein [Rhodobacter amnigenus]
MKTYSLVINGRSVPSDRHFDVKNPANGGIVGSAPKATKEQLELAIEAAEAAFPAWRDLTSETRAEYCMKVADRMQEAAEELAQLITREQGKPLNGLGSRWEVGGAIAWARYTASLDLPVEVLQDTNQGKVEMHRKPLGVVGSITPWNFPVLIAIWHVIPAIRSGNTVVIKPSPYTPLSTIRLVELMSEVLPQGVVNCVTGEDFIGAEMSAHPKIRKIVFTGSCATGQKIMQSAAQTMKRLTLELGGNDAGIVLPDVDPKQIAEGLFWGAFINGGQTCAALKRLYVHDEVYDAVCRELVDYARNIKVGDGLLDDTNLGPIQNRQQFEKVVALVDDAKKVGGKVLLGGAVEKKGPGNFFPVTLIADMNNGQRLVDEEQFGPVLPIIRYTDVEEVIQRANDNPNGLGGSVWSRDIEKAKQIASRMECGSVWINKHGAIQPNAPFGGVKSSGFGVEFAKEGLAEYTDIQVIFS